MNEALHRVKAMALSKSTKDASLLRQGDLLLRLFESEWFNEYMALQYLYQNPQPGVEDYLCNKLLNMPEAAIERYLLQFVYLAVSRPGSALERTIIALCSKSFCIALKVHWLLLALCQDHTKSKHVEQLKDRCERAALEGEWEVPFRVTKLDPLSPQNTLSPEASGMLSPILSPLTQAPINVIMACSPPTNGNGMPMLATPGILTQIDEGGEHGLMSPVMSGGGGIGSTAGAATGANWSAVPALPPPPPRIHTHKGSSRQPRNGSSGGAPLHEYIQRIRAELGDGEGVTALLHKSVGGAVAVAEDDLLLSDDDVAGGLFQPPTPVSPTTRVRHDTYGATLDFMDTLCEASNSLCSISQEERQRALRHTLEAINKELEKTARRDIAVWFPMGKRNERVLRITAKEAVLLNSREKAPFMLFMEVLVTDEGPGQAAQGPALSPTPQPSLTLPYPLGPSGLPVLPGAPLSSVQGTLTGMSPYLASLVSGVASPQSLLPPLAPPPTRVSTPAPNSTQQEAEQGQAAAPGTGVAETESPREDGNGAGESGSQGPSTASSNGISCSIGTSISVGTMPTPTTGGPSVPVSPRASTDEPSPTVPADAPTVPVSKATDAVPASKTGVIPSTLDAIQSTFRGRESSSQPGSATRAAAALDNRQLQSSNGSLYSATDLVHMSSGSLVGTTGSAGCAVVIPHRRRQTTDFDHSNGSSQGFSLAGGLLPGTASPGLFVLPPGSQGGITCAADVAAEGMSPIKGSEPLPIHSPTTRLSTSGAPRTPPATARGLGFPETAVPPPTRAPPSTSQTPSPPSEPSAWASAISTLQRVLLPSSSSSSSAPAALPAASSLSATLSPISGGQQQPLPSLQMPEKPSFDSVRRSLELRPVTPLSVQDVAELIQAGALPAPQQASGAAGPAGSFNSKIAGALASLRGEAPLVRLQLRVLPAAHAAEAAAAARAQRPTSPAPGDSRPGSVSGSNPNPSEGDPPGSSPSSLLTSGSAKALNLLSKIGLCARPNMDDEDTASPPNGRRWGSGLSGSSGVGAAAEAPVRLVAISLEVAGGVNLAITSPYRKSRRTPSHEAISMVATQLKIYELPPPLELGPPLLPPEGGLSSQGSGADSWDNGPGPQLPSRRSTALAEDQEQHHVVASMASFSSLALAAGVPNPPGPGAGGGTLLDAVRPQVPHITSASTTPRQTSSSNVVLSFPHAAQLDLSSPRMMAPQSQPGTSPQRQLVTPAHNKVGGLPMVGGMVSAAAAAAPGVLSPDPMMTSPDQYTPSAATQSSILSLAVSARPVSDPVQVPTTSPFAAPTILPPAAPQAGDAVSEAQATRDTREPTVSLLPDQPLQPPQPAPAATQQQQQQPTSHTAAVGAGAGGPSVSRSKAVGQSLSKLQVGFERRSNEQGGLAGSHPRLVPSGGSGFPLSSLESIGLGVPPCSIKLDAATEKKRREAWAVYGERWASKARRIQRESPHGPRKGWALRCVIVKSGDDCRQELLAVQLIRTFAEIFAEASLPLWVRPYDVLVTSNKTAMIEVVSDSLSIHTVKHRSPPGASLSDHFFAKWPRGSSECLAAQRRFTESLAAYSIICYLMQIKDRHNGNVLIDDEGHLVHIDFGFMLSNSPGGVNFEAAPFKLTRELLEVMDSNSEGKPSELFDYFKVLMIQGFLACRKHHDRLVLLVRMMCKSGLPCFKTGERSVKALEKRLSLHMTEVQAMQAVLGLISDSLDAWRTRQYDYYQRLLNGIL